MSAQNFINEFVEKYVKDPRFKSDNPLIQEVAEDPRTWAILFSTIKLLQKSKTEQEMKEILGDDVYDLLIETNDKK